MEALEQQTEIAILEPEHTLFVRAGGDITIGNAMVLRDDVRAAWDEAGAVSSVIVDLWEVRHLDSSGLGTLMELASHAKNLGVSLCLCRLQDSPRRLLNRTGLGSLFQIYDTVEAAIHSSSC